MSLRLLTQGEIFLARSVFEDTIDYPKVWVHNDTYFWFGLQQERTAMTPNGEMYYPDKVYSRDFSSTALPGENSTTVQASHLFVHEMTHVWQYQKGYSVKLHGMLSWAADYKYDLYASSLMSYSMEQQASLIADYWLLKNHGFDKDPYNVNYKGNINEPPETLLQKYEYVLGLFPRCAI